MEVHTLETASNRWFGHKEMAVVFPFCSHRYQRDVRWTAGDQSLVDPVAIVGQVLSLVELLLNQLSISEFFSSIEGLNSRSRTLTSSE